MQKIYGTWVTSKITFKDGSPLPDEHVLKYIYLKYQFSRPDKLNLSTIYFEQGPENLFEINNNFLFIKSPVGGLINSFRIEALKDTLVLLQQGPNGFEDAAALKFYFVPEVWHQNSMPLRPDNIFSVKGRDTVYKQSRKLYASYKAPSFQSYIYTGIRDRISINGRAGHLAATFVVSKPGVADSVKILEGIDDEFNSRFLKVFNQSKKTGNQPC